MDQGKRLLIVSNGPVPTPGQTVVEGGGLRCWGLARGLAAQPGAPAVTVAYQRGFFKPGSTGRHDGIDVSCWDLPEVPDLIARFDAVLVSYCMGELTRTIVRAARPDQQIILDCYVPIHVEVCARESADRGRELQSYVADAEGWHEALRRGDLFLCASEAQRLYYLGVLASCGRLNPQTYGEELLLVVPYGTYRDAPITEDKPITRAIGGSSAAKVLWFGGVYPWFDLRGLIDAVGLVDRETPAKLVIVGAKNPFTTHPDFLARSREVIEHAARPEHRERVVVQDWVDFHQRADWYLDADIVVLVNRPGDENRLAWRTRLVDFIWAGVPIVTNGGDPLGERLIAAGAAERFPSLEPTAMASTLADLLSDRGRLEGLRRQVARFRDELAWDAVTAPLAAKVAEGRRGRDLAPRSAPANVDTPTTLGPPSKLRRAAQLARKVPRYVRDHGLRATWKKVEARLAPRLRRLTPPPTREGPRIVVLSHFLDLSGAPYVLIDLVRHMVGAGLGEHLTFFTYPPADRGNLKRVVALGLKPKVLANPCLAPPLAQGDVVLLNTVGFHRDVLEEVLLATERGVVKALVWYIHEDDPERLFTPSETKRVRRLIQRGRLTMVVLARGAHERFRRHFGVDILREPYRFDLPAEHHLVRGPADFDELRFILPGSVGDGRKGQLVVLYALAAFYGKYYKDDPALYRDFNLTFVGLEESFLTQQIERHRGIHGDRLRCVGKVDRAGSLRLIREANVTICYSLRECLPLFVFEGMLAGHPILRNECSGVDEQLEDGRNGFLVRGDDFWHLVERFEQILNRRKTSNEQLAAMSRRSHDMALARREHGYDGIIGVVKGAFFDSDAAPRTLAVNVADSTSERRAG